MILGMTGKRGCGKDTVANYFVSEFGYKMLDFTHDILAPILVNQGKEVSRENLMELAMGSRKKYHNGIWAEKLSHLIKMQNNMKFVISGIRFSEEVAVFKKMFGDEFKLIAIVVEAKRRHERVIRRGTKGEAHLSFQEFCIIENKPTESIISETMKLADYIIDNNSTLNQLKNEVIKLGKLLKVK